MSSSHVLHVDWVTAGALGEPGERTFLLQAHGSADYVAVICEKEQVAALAQVARELLDDARAPLTDAEAESGDLRLAPVVPLWRVGVMAVGYDPESQRYLLRVEQRGDTGDGVLDLVLRRDQLAGLAADALFSLDAGARDRCRLCGQLLDPDGVHWCEASGDRPTFVV